MNIRIAIIGAGGLGANIASVLSEQGHDIVIIDADRCDEKFFNRYPFFAGSRALYKNAPKVNAVAASARARGKFILPISVMADENFDFEQIKDRFVIISVDTAQAREIIEAKLKTVGAKYIHAGCNLNSISIFKSILVTGMKPGAIIADDTPIDASTSYDVVPDPKTYLRAATKIAEMLDQPIRMYEEA